MSAQGHGEEGVSLPSRESLRSHGSREGGPHPTEVPLDILPPIHLREDKRLGSASSLWLQQGNGRGKRKEKIAALEGKHTENKLSSRLN